MGRERLITIYVDFGNRHRVALITQEIGISIGFNLDLDHNQSSLKGGNNCGNHFTYFTISIELFELRMLL